MILRCMYVVAVAFIALGLASCMSLGVSTPNTSIIDPTYDARGDQDVTAAQDALSAIASCNELLASEIGKIPELQDGVGASELRALRNIQLYYERHPVEFDKAFKEMHAVGKPGARRYCTPLQAVFWLAEVGYFPDNGDVIEHYSLQRLIGLAWDIPDPGTTQRLLRIINEYRDESDRREALALYAKASFNSLKLRISQDYHSVQDMFTEAGKEYVRQEMAVVQEKKPRWADYQTVVARINSPELFNMYMNRFITYRGGYRAHGALATFKTGVGHCTDAAYLAQHMMRSAGYETFMRSVRWGASDWTDVHTSTGVVLDDGRYLLVADFWADGTNALGGPYRTLEEVNMRMSRGEPLIHSAWGAYFPPPSP